MLLKPAVLCAFALSSLAQAVEFRAATFNIGAHFTTSSSGVYYPDYSLGAPGTPDHDSVRDILHRIDADVVALEEIHGADITAGDVDALATGLGYAHVYIAPATNTFDPSLRVAIFSRFPFLAQTSVNSPTAYKEMNRLIPAVKIDVPSTTRDPVVVAAHLKSGSDASDAFQRTVEMRRLTDHLAAQGLTAADNFVIMGDFNLSSSDRTFISLPASGLPATFDLGADIVFPIQYFTNPVSYFSSPAATRILPRQLDNSTVTFPSGGSTIDLFLVSPVIGSRPSRSEIYNSALDVSNAAGLPKSGSPLAAGTSAAASDHYALFADFELDPAVPYTFTAAGQTVTEAFTGFPGAFDPYPWATTGGAWQGMDSGTSATTGFRSYGSAEDSSLGFLPGTAGGDAVASFVNQSAEILSALQISFTAEQWRSAAGGTSDRLDVELIVGGVPTPLPQLAFQAATNLPAGAIAGGVSSPRNMMVTGLAIEPGAAFQLRFIFTPGPGGGPRPAEVFINEFHYDDDGADLGEFVEIVVGPGFTGSPGDVSLLLYNGLDGTTYGTHSLSTFTAGAVTGSGHVIYSKSISGIQNGAPDGFALVVNGIVTQFISYEGTFTATAGAANGLRSTDIGKSQVGTEPEGKSAIGLKGTAGTSAAFYWERFDDISYSPGQPNSGQTFTVPPQPQGIAIDDFAVTFLPGGDSDSDGFSDADEAVFGTNPLDAASRFTMTFANPSPTPGAVRLAFPTATGRTYVVESSPDLSIWTGVANFAGTGSPQVADIPVVPEEKSCFYRIRAVLP
jgi:hypothetical protein